MKPATKQTRQCDTCTACCDGWLRITVQGHAVHPGKPCPFSSGHRCTIYETRPQDPYRAFICGWLARNSPLPDWMRPDRAGMIPLPANFAGGDCRSMWRYTEALLKSMIYGLHRTIDAVSPRERAVR